MIRCWMYLGAAIAILGQGIAAGAAETELGKGLEAFGFASSEQGVRECLEGFTLSQQNLDKITTLLKQLDDDKFVVRQRAMAQLARMPMLDRDLLRRACEAPSREVRYRARYVEKQTSPEAAGIIMEAALGLVVRKKIKGLTHEILAAIPQVPPDPLWKSAQEALATTVESDDEPFLCKSLTSQSAIVRISAASGLIRLLDERADRLLLPLLADSDERIRLLVATTLGNHGHRACLETFAKLLESPNFRVRWKSGHALRRLSEKDFGYRPDVESSERSAATARWKSWVQSAGQSAKLHFPIGLPKELVLFNGVNLEGWCAVVDGEVLNAQDTWSVVNGNLFCSGEGANGPNSAYLRTKSTFSNYVLELQWRFPNGSGDSGVGVMMAGEDKNSPDCLEVQIEYGNAGDLYRIGSFQADAGGKKLGFQASKLKPSSESPPGKWNQLEIKVLGGNADVVVNGVLQNKATNCTKSPGRINLRNEGSPVEFRHLTLLPLDE